MNDNPKKLSISFRKFTHKNGAEYNQTITIPKKELSLINHEISKAKEEKFHSTFQEINDYMYLSNLTDSEPNYATITTMLLVCDVLYEQDYSLKRIDPFRNTRFVFR